MKNTSVLKIFGSAVLAAAAVLGVSAAPVAQQIKVNLPYAVTIGGTTAPAGEYTVQVLGEATGGPVLLFSSKNGFAAEAFATMAPLNGSQVNSKTSVVLKQQGDKRALDKILVEGQDFSYEFSK